MNNASNTRTIYLERLRAMRGMPPAVARLAAEHNLSPEEEALVTRYVDQICEQIHATRNEVFRDEPAEMASCDALLESEDPDEDAWLEFESWIGNQFPRQQAF